MYLNYTFKYNPDTQKTLYITITIAIVMATTIQVSETTRQLLESYKMKQKESSYDKVLHNLLAEKMKIPKSMFGAAKGLKWTKADRGDDREL